MLVLSRKPGEVIVVPQCELTVTVSVSRCARPCSTRALSAFLRWKATKSGWAFPRRTRSMCIGKRFGTESVSRPHQRTTHDCCNGQ